MSKNSSSGSRSSGNRSGGGNVQSILSQIGVGTPNIRIRTIGTEHTGVYLGITDGSAIINENGVPRYIKLSKITAVEVGV
ncbi:hypothetical protein FHS16_005093 [Paenibacillus endophyticus]|uniref:DUF2642 domain-containing protein n=1 Tax=Paenibacillus endophyticus TaxID=1294268 RepID=A0A7W5CD78_9BACL|nr:hypothetical protein [Paenibacillus endophyticus]MBB3154994.1 hypothetical protein [Paenibacillus endophyticus]